MAFRKYDVGGYYSVFSRISKNNVKNSCAAVKILQLIQILYNSIRSIPNSIDQVRELALQEHSNIVVLRLLHNSGSVHSLKRNKNLRFSFKKVLKAVRKGLSRTIIMGCENLQHKTCYFWCRYACINFSVFDKLRPEPT